MERGPGLGFAAAEDEGAAREARPDRIEEDELGAGDIGELSPTPGGRQRQSGGCRRQHVDRFRTSGVVGAARQ